MKNRYNLEMLTTIGTRILGLLIYYQKNIKSKTQNYNFASCFVWVWNLVSSIEEKR
jgi:hypothetical protein